MRTKRAYSLIELIIAIALVAILIIPIALMFKDQVTATIYSGNINQAVSLARLEMARINNLTYNDTTLADGYDNTSSNYEEYSFDLKRTVDYVADTDDNLKEVNVFVYPGGTTDLLINLATYKTSVSFGSGSGGGGAGGGGDEADSLAVSDGEVKKKKLEKVTIENTGGDNIVLTKVIVTFAGAGGIYFKKLKIDGTTYWEGNASSGSTITLDTSFTLTAGTEYNEDVKFEFEKNLTTADVIFVFQDDTQSTTYSW